MANMLLDPDNALSLDEETALVSVLCASLERASGPHVLGGKPDKIKVCFI